MTGPDPSTPQDTDSINLSNLNVFVTYEDAKRLVNLGFSVFPIKPRDKVPAIDSWKEFQERKPTEEELHKWFDDGNKNIAIVCVKISGGLVVVDFDDKETLEFLIQGGSPNLSKRLSWLKRAKGSMCISEFPKAYYRIEGSTT